jgi:DNA-binding NarL/FixJ family response regulator
MKMNLISILIIENHTIVRAGLKSLLLQNDDFEVVGEAGFEDILTRTVSLKPRIVLLSLISNGSHDIPTTLRDLCQEVPATQFLILARSENDQSMLQALRFGALGCLVSDSTSQDLVDSIYELARGGSYLPSQVGKKLIQRIANPEMKDNFSAMLTQRQLQVLKLISQGFTNQEIAATMVISKRTVEMHTYRLFRRLKVSNRAQAIQLAIRIGMVEMEKSAVFG